MVLDTYIRLLGRISTKDRSSSELESCVGLLGKVKNGVDFDNLGQDRERLGSVGDKGGVGLEW